MIGRIGSSIQIRQLGTQARGPRHTDLATNYLFAKQFFRGGAVTYNDFKQQCMSLRIFVMFGITFYYSYQLITNPLKSSYWKSWGPLSVPGNAIGLFSASPNEVFLSKPAERMEDQIPAMDALAQLTLKRRLDSDVAED